LGYGSSALQDSFGRVERPHAISGSNLFKYGEPFHGLAVFKHHDPLNWSIEQLADLLDVSASWFEAAQETHAVSRMQGLQNAGARGHPEETEATEAWGPRADRQLHTFFLWNCLARSGASQFHGHAQLMATRVPVPSQALLDAQSKAYAAQHPGRNYARDMLNAHREAGLLRACAGSQEDAEAFRRGAGEGRPRCWLAACLTPIKDMEVLVAVEAPTGAQVGQANVAAAGEGLTCPAFVRGLHSALRAIIDTFGMNSFNVGILRLPTKSNAPHSLEDLPHSMLLARVVSRGHSSKVASDYGCLEVLGGASIGNTDPFRVIDAVDQQLGHYSIPLAAVVPI